MDLSLMDQTHQIQQDSSTNLVVNHVWQADRWALFGALHFFTMSEPTEGKQEYQFEDAVEDSKNDDDSLIDIFTAAAVLKEDSPMDLPRTESDGVNVNYQASKEISKEDYVTIMVMQVSKMHLNTLHVAGYSASAAKNHFQHLLGLYEDMKKANE